jgi:hypothetical protein
MYIPKRYGESHMDTCPFCGRQAINKNPQDIPVCKDHKDKCLPEMKCACGEYLLMQKGKFGVFFNCIRCGNINMKKALDINSHLLLKPMDTPKIVRTETKETFGNSETSRKSSSPKKQESGKESEIQTVRSDDPRYFG